MQSQKHRTTDTAGHVAIRVALSCQCFLSGERMSGETCFINNALPFVVQMNWFKFQKKSYLANKSQSAGMLRQRNTLTWYEEWWQWEQHNPSDCLDCKLLSRKIILCFQTPHFSLMNPIRTERSQKVAINIKITLLNK